MIGFIKTKTQKQYYSKKQKLQYKRLKILKEEFECFFKEDIIQTKKNIKKIKDKNILDDIRLKLTNPFFLESYSKLNYDLQIKELSSYKSQNFLYNDELNSEIFFTDIQYFNQFYKSSYFNLDFLNLSNHYLNLYGKNEIKNVKIQSFSNQHKNGTLICFKNKRYSLKFEDSIKNNTSNINNTYFSNFMTNYRKNILDDSNKFLRSKRSFFDSTNLKNYVPKSENIIEKSNIPENINEYFSNFMTNHGQEDIFDNSIKFFNSTYLKNDSLKFESLLQKSNTLENANNNAYFSNFMTNYGQNILYDSDKFLRSKRSFFDSKNSQKFENTIEKNNIPENIHECFSNFASNYRQNIFDNSNKFLRSKTPSINLKNNSNQSYFSNLKELKYN